MDIYDYISLPMRWENLQRRHLISSQTEQMNEYVELKGGKMLEAPVTGGILQLTGSYSYCILLKKSKPSMKI
jgi:hypothetical protein